MLYRAIVAGVGFNWRRVLRGFYGIGFNPGDYAILVNSEPRDNNAVEAMNILSSRLSELGLSTKEFWLDPTKPFEENVAIVRSFIEDRAPCTTVFLIGGGFRWLSALLMMTAMILKSISFVGVDVEKIRIEIEEELESRAVSVPTLYIEIPVVPKFVNISVQDYDVLKAIAKKGKARVKNIIDETSLSRTVVVKRLKKLLDLGLIKSETRGKGNLYSLTQLGVMLAHKVLQS
ncbi:MAG: CRISPR-associated CARF protein Csa3 [Acidilobaceae archaeon]